MIERQLRAYFLLSISCSFLALNSPSCRLYSDENPCLSKGSPAGGVGYVIEGTLVTMDAPGRLEGGRLYIRDGKIEALVAKGEETPQTLATVERPVIRTDGYVFPGFLNLHTHVPFNVQPLWVAGKSYANRYQWQRDPNHVPAVMYPYFILTGEREYNLLNEATLFAEVRALVGGTTALIFSEECLYTAGRLVRNLEHEPAPTGGIYPSVTRFDDRFMAGGAKAIKKRLDKGELRAWVAHLAEGMDGLSSDEFDRLGPAGLLRPELVVVHGVGLNRAQLRAFGEVGGHLVWSPSSNYILYGETADIKSALQSGVTVSLSNDWAPSGTHNLLAELKAAAAAYRFEYGESLPAKLLVEMITVNPAKAIGWEDRAGKLKAGLCADVVIFEKLSDDPYTTLLQATEEQVELVAVGGDALFGSPRIMGKLKPGDSERWTIRSPTGHTYEKRIDVTQEAGDATLRITIDRLNRALQFSVADMVETFQVSSHELPTEETMSEYLAQTYPGLEQQPLPPIFLSEDGDFFKRLSSIDVPYFEELRAVYRPSDKGTNLPVQSD